MTEERVKRKLSAILSADVAGYSRLMGEDEVSTVRTLEAYRNVMSDLIEQFRGRVVDSPGDNLLAEFTSVVDAVQCAVEIHEIIRAKNEELPEDRRMLFRIGVNLGDVIEEGERIYGDGVNIAARLEGLAEPGGVCLSGSAYEQIKNKLALGYEYIGEHSVKNITEPLKVYKVPVGPKAVTPKEEKEKETKLKNWQWAAFGAAGAIILIIGALATWNFYPREPSIEPAPIEAEQAPVAVETIEVKESPKTIAVLPFDDLSPEKDQDYFVLGLSEEILNSLAQIEDLTVIAKTSSFSFKGKDKTIQEIASVLGVDHVLEGSVRKAGNALRITAQLIRANDGAHLWSKTYDKEFTKVEEMFSVQEDIATAVTNELKVTLGIESIQRTIGGTESLEAYELYLVTLGQENNGDFNLALESIDSAISIDQKFALAWNLKAQIHIDLVIFGAGNQAVTEKDAALNAAQRAIELEPKLGPAYVTLGFIKTQKGDWIEAESAYRKAFELSAGTLPGLSLANVEAPIHYTAVGHFKRTLELLEAARKNDPLNQIISTWYFFTLGLLDDMQRAEEEYERCRGLPGVNPAGMVYDMISRLRLGTGNVVQGDEIVSSNPIHEVIKKHLGSPGKGLVELRRIYTDNDNLSSDDFYEIALGAAYFGDDEFAMDAMERAAGLDSSGIFELWFPVYSRLRQMPRFKDFIEKIGLIDYWEEFSWPDICRPLGNGDFECD